MMNADAFVDTVNDCDYDCIQLAAFSDIDTDTESVSTVVTMDDDADDENKASIYFVICFYYFFLIFS